MKYTHMIFAVSISFFGLNAMTPDVTEWQEICKNPKEKEQLMTIYKDFCQKRLKNNIAWTAGSFAPFIFKSVRKDLALCGLIGLFTLRQTYLLGRNTYRNQLATQEDLSYLNHDVLEQLGNPSVLAPYSSYSNINRFDVVFYDYKGVSVKKIFGYRPRLDRCTGRLSANNVNDIEKALSGNYKASCVLETPLIIKKKAELMIKYIKDAMR